MVEGHPFWYHTMELRPGLVTPGWFDLRPVLPVIPIPDVRGKRCLDIGTFDGFFAFELERRGAAEVVATDIPDHTKWDWPHDARPDESEATHVAFRGPEKGEGFRIAAEITGSSVQWRALNIYDLDPADIGTFDVVFCGSLLLHLREPLRALEAVRRVCDGYFLSSEQIELWLSIFGRGRPLARLSGSGSYMQWWVPNAAGHAQMLRAAGFTIERASRPYLVRFGQHGTPPPTLKTAIDRIGRLAATGTWAPGVLHRALLARPADYATSAPLR